MKVLTKSFTFYPKDVEIQTPKNETGA